ncbi:MAG: glycosyltransferase family A protein [Saonia sp.]
MKYEKFKISFCTVCMNRLHHLKQTLPQNIEDNIDYGNIEFVILNYNSQDGIDEWITANFSEYIDNEILTYIKTKQPKHFQMSHSKNVVAKHANGNIVCNVDADNFLGKGFANFINKNFKTDENIYLAVDKKIAPRDCYGRICVRKADFMYLRGYDESMTGYGFEDFDFRNRLGLLGRKTIYISNEKYLKALIHDDKTRLKNEPNAVQIEKVYIHYIKHYTSELLYLFKDGIFFRGRIVLNRLSNSKSIDNLFIENRTFEFGNRLENNIWDIGEWKQIERCLYLVGSNQKKQTLIEIDHKRLVVKNREDICFYRITNRALFENVLMFFSQINNRIKMEKNRFDNKLLVNLNSFGETTLLK